MEGQVTIAAGEHSAVWATPAEDARRWALIALAALLIEEMVSSLLFILRGRYAPLQAIPTIAIGTVVTHWILPFAIVYLLERRDARALGLTVRRDRVAAYVVWAFIGLALPALIVGVDRGLLMEFVEQVVYIGVAEEVFFRGYLTGRLCSWLGNLRGLLLSGLIFGLAHIVSRLSQHGLAYPAHDAVLGVQTFLGGMLFGFIYLRAQSIVPVTILHVGMNAYLGRVMETLSR